MDPKNKKQQGHAKYHYSVYYYYWVPSPSNIGFLLITGNEGKTFVLNPCVAGGTLHHYSKESAARAKQQLLIFTLLRSIVSNASCLRRSRRSLLDSDHEATPPEPVLPPALFWKSILNWQIHRNYKRNMKYGDEEETGTWRKTRN